MKGVYIFLADGFEDIEALATRDVLVRGGVDVQTVSISDDPFVVSSHGLTVCADCMLSDLSDGGADTQDVMIFPGGMPGSKHLADCKALIRVMNSHYAEGGTVAAICAAPGLVLSQLKGIGDAVFTCYEGCQDATVAKGAIFVRKPAVTCGRIITGRGPGHAIQFALEVLKMIKGEECAQAVEAGMILTCE